MVERENRTGGTGAGVGNDNGADGSDEEDLEELHFDGGRLESGNCLEDESWKVWKIGCLVVWMIGELVDDFEIGREFSCYLSLF